MGRQPCCDKLGVKKGPWTAEEDQKLINFILTNGQCCWRAVPKVAGLRRCGKSCRLRWTNYLRPDLKRGLLSDAEEQLVIELHARLGNRWSKIAARLPGRTDNEIKNHWNTHIKKKLLRMGIDPVTHEPLQKEDDKPPIETYTDNGNDIQLPKSEEDQNVEWPESTTNSPEENCSSNELSQVVDTVFDDDLLISLLENELLQVDAPRDFPAPGQNLSNPGAIPTWDENCSSSSWLVDCQDFGVDDFGFDCFDEMEIQNVLSTLEMDSK